MRVMTVSEIKRDSYSPHRNYPTPGSAADQVYQILVADKGRYAQLGGIGRVLGRHILTRAISRLMDDYGMDIRRHNRHKNDGLYVLAGEWFGAHYEDYLAQAYHANSPSLSEAS